MSGLRAVWLSGFVYVDYTLYLLYHYILHFSIHHLTHIDSFIPMSYEPYLSGIRLNIFGLRFLLVSLVIFAKFNIYSRGLRVLSNWFTNYISFAIRIHLVFNLIYVY